MKRRNSTAGFSLPQEQLEYLRAVAKEDYRTVSGLLRIFIQDCLPDYRIKLQANRDRIQGISR